MSVDNGWVRIMINGVLKEWVCMGMNEMYENNE